MMKLFLLLLASTMTSASFPFFLRKPETDSKKSDCVTECKHGNVEEDLVGDNLHIVCMDAVEKFSHDYNDCIDLMTQALDLGEEEAKKQYCEFICPYSDVRK